VPDIRAVTSIEILYVAGCPNVGPARRLVKDVVAEIGIRAPIGETEITDPTHAQARRFLGSPTVRINGVDVDPSASACTRFGLMCRVYREGTVSSGVPARDLIERALRRAVDSQD
jgi:hypothetical protein